MAGVAQPPQEATLQRAERDVRVAAHDRAELRRAGPVRTPRQHRLDPPRRRAVMNARLMTHPSEVVDVQCRGEIDERPRRRGHRDGAPDHDVAAIDLPSSSRANARNPPSGAHQHLGRRRRAPEHPQQVRGRPAHEPSPRTARPTAAR